MATKVWLMGDSTVHSGDSLPILCRGWGQLIQFYFDNNVVFYNHAKSGRSSKSFIDEGRFGRVLEQLGTGDVVMIQFGHNDQKTDALRYTDPAGQYRINLRYFIDSARAKGAIPVLITSVCRRHFDTDGKLKDTHGAYLIGMKEVAKEKEVALIDLEDKSRRLLTYLGPYESKRLFFRQKPLQTKSNPYGVNDDTHFNMAGARIIAALVVEGIVENELTIKESLVIKA